MKSLILLLFCFSLIFVDGQKVHSIYVLTTKENFQILFKILRSEIVLFCIKIQLSEEKITIGDLMKLKRIYFVENG